MKKFYATIISLVMFFSLFCGASVKPAKAAEENDILYVGSDGSVEGQDTDVASDTDAEELFSDSLELDNGVATDNYDEVWKLLKLINEKRVKEGKRKLVMDKKLMKAAEVRARELSVRFSNERPNGNDWDTILDEWGVTDCYASAQNVTNSVNDMSAEHYMKNASRIWQMKENMLCSDYNAIGIACVDIPGSKYGRYWVQVYAGLQSPDVVMDATGIYVVRSDKNGVKAGLTVYNPSDAELEYSWYASKDNGNTWIKAQDWKKGNEWLNWKPNEFGDYVLVAKVRQAGNNKHIYQSSTSFSFHPIIKGKCQMPYTGEGGGYLIGVESYDNPNQSYRYEMLILDCTLLAAGKPAWIYSTGKCAVPENALWTVWQPQYGYYWTLFRVYDKSGKMIDEVCYGFQNI